MAQTETLAEQVPSVQVRNVLARGRCDPGEPKKVSVDLSSYPLRVFVSGLWSGADVAVAQKAILTGVTAVKSMKVHRTDVKPPAKTEEKVNQEGEATNA